MPPPEVFILTFWMFTPVIFFVVNGSLFWAMQKLMAKLKKITM
jgi:hypothetical protein